MQLNCRRTFQNLPMQLTQLNSIQPISAKQVSRVFVDLVLDSITLRMLSIVDLTELFYVILPILNKLWPTNSPVNKQPLQLLQFCSWSVLTVNLRYTMIRKLLQRDLPLALFCKILAIDVVLLIHLSQSTFTLR